MIIRNVPHFENRGPAFEKIRRNPDPEVSHIRQPKIQANNLWLAIGGGLM